jgi:hypothetical protein
MRKAWRRFGSARADKASTATALDDLKSYAEIATAHAEGLKKFLPVFETLYGSMSDAQKAQADTLFRGPQHYPVGGEEEDVQGPEQPEREYRYVHQIGPPPVQAGRALRTRRK